MNREIVLGTTQDLQMTANVQNKHCHLSSLRNESDVEQNFLIHLLTDLGFTEEYRETKATVRTVQIGKGKRRRTYALDYVCFLDKGHLRPVLIADAKAPSVDAMEGVEDAQLYASVIRRKLQSPKPDQFCLGSNGHLTRVKHHDSDTSAAELPFSACQDGNAAYDTFRTSFSRARLQVVYHQQQPESPTWTPKYVSIEEIKDVFKKCHNRIWKRESLFPTSAFYEFTKLVFLKLREDERVHKTFIDQGREVRMSDLHFHTLWIDNNSEVSPNPINSILFRQLTEDLDEQVRKNKKKPIFHILEQINLKPSTIRGVVELLQPYDLSEIDEDLNGRMFEVFLSAAVRGKNLGAFFTPRGIVEVMVGMSSLNITRSGKNVTMDTVLDGCCGSGGFLIDAMAEMLARIRTVPSLTPHREELSEQLLHSHLFGIESNPDIARIARINMYLHGDGGSRIYHADTLDKSFVVEEGEPRATQDEVTELRETFVTQQQRFDVILTNPPFASSYSASDEHEARILAQYPELLTAGEGKPKTTVKSNILFIARYYDFLKPSGRMLIVVDNSLLNSYSFIQHRRWILDNFIIRAVISLPKYSFIQAGAGGVTSILYLEKRTGQSQQQPSVFAQVVAHTGISKSGKEIDDNDLPNVLKNGMYLNSLGTWISMARNQLGHEIPMNCF